MNGSTENAAAHVSALHVYPLKGARGLSLQEVEVDDFGPRGDRRWLAVDADGVFVSQRELPRLALVHAAVEADALVLSSDGFRAQRVERPAGPCRRVRIWRDTVEAVDAGDEASEWLSEVLQHDVRLVHMPDETFRPVDGTYGRPGDHVSFADAFPFLILGQSSLDALNARLAEPLPMNRFRPNIVVAGAAPHAEDAWREIAIGTLRLDVVKPCARCVVTTIDQERALPGREPLRTLASYRKVGAHVMFGMNAIHRGRGVLRVGDAIHGS